MDKLGALLGATFNGIFGDDKERKKADQDLENFMGVGAKCRPVRQARHALEKDILGKLKTGSLRAYGHSLSRNAEDKRVQIPNALNLTPIFIVRS